ncbi:spore coat U domain-containing protein [Erythrobacter neustonensis]|nr:spore coat U domain-containing protein [Erythrobacter neustonensis]
MSVTPARLIRMLGTLLAAFLMLGLTAPSPALACTLCSCTATASAASFGTYNPVSTAPTDTTATITVNCTGLVSLLGSVEISASAGSSGNRAQRTLRQGGNALAYNLYTDPARTIVFGDGTAGTQNITLPLNGLLIFGQSALVHGRIPARQWARTGSYADTIVVTIVY